MGKPKGPPPDSVFSNLDGDHSPNRNQAAPPRYRSNFPSMGRGRGYSCCCWCCCSFLFFLVLVIAALTITIACLNPKPPTYDIDNLSFLAFNISEDLTLHTKLNFSVKATNPNRKIGVTYGANSKVKLTYRDVELCAGELPGFYQGYNNVTVVSIVMEGSNSIRPETRETLKEDKRNGEIPINLKMTVDVQLRIFGTDSSTVTTWVKGLLIVNNVDPGNKTEIKRANYDVQW